jgi:Uri superfamily endonuclease
LLEFAEVIDVKILQNISREKEVAYAEKWLAIADFVPVRKFGASDSTAESHLTGFYTKKRIIQSGLWNCGSAWQMPVSN